MIIINSLGFLLIILIIWWFWLYKPNPDKASAQLKSSNNTITVVVENGIYSPSKIIINPQQTTRIQFLRKDPNPCAAVVLFPDIEVSLDLALNQLTSIELPKLTQGEYPFHCQMQMYRGTLIVD